MFNKIITLLFCLSMLCSSSTGYSWYDANAAGAAPEWHYRVPVNIPANTPVNSTIKIDVDFNTLMNTLGISGTFDNNSPRIIRPNETLANNQEYTDQRYSNVLDATSNGRGEVKFILQDAGATTYYLYFDTIENGAKPANPSQPINGNFEHSSTGSSPTGWLVSSTNANGAQNNETYDTSYGSTYTQPAGTPTCSDQSISNADNSPNNSGSSATTTGRKWHLLGYRDNCEDGGNAREKINLSKTFTVPATHSGNLTFFFQLQAYDSWNGGNTYDYFKLSVNNSVVDHTALGIANTGGQLHIESAGMGRANQYSTTLVDSGWQKATLNLSSYAGSTITIKFTTDFFTDSGYRTWVKLDDIEWSIQSASLGTPEAIPPVISVQKTSLVISDGVNSSNPKRIPGAIVEYTIIVTNTGYGETDNNSIVINDAIPANTEYIVNSLQFIDGTTTSGLTANSTSFSYSADGVVYNNNQSTATRHLRVSPQGKFLAATSASTPSFQIKFSVHIL